MRRSLRKCVTRPDLASSCVTTGAGQRDLPQRSLEWVSDRTRRFLAASAAAVALGGILAAGAPALPIPGATTSVAATLPTITLVQQPPSTTSAATATFAWT